MSGSPKRCHEESENCQYPHEGVEEEEEEGVETQNDGYGVSTTHLNCKNFKPELHNKRVDLILRRNGEYEETNQKESVAEKRGRRFEKELDGGMEVDHYGIQPRKKMQRSKGFPHVRFCADINRVNYSMAKISRQPSSIASRVLGVSFLYVPLKLLAITGKAEALSIVSHPRSFTETSRATPVSRPPTAMVVNARPLKRMKSRVTADLYDFLTFPSSVSSFASGPFRTNVRAFLSKHAILPPPSSLFPHLLTSQILFRVGDLDSPDSLARVVCLDIIEEDVAISRSIYCDQCRVVGE
ncbi:hypothetical protein TorRG33x02_006310 [Trema orientale]|uniref:Uncharacterized protein n=1 Tax=Trema orientale TaxID=63057 RepID=A0A2P5G060_TREOI|nr:hypothetical protein TorRG33x02_006310 [Trema orientale]